MLQVGLEAFLELVAVGPLHDEDDIGPLHQFGRDGLFRVMVQPGRGGLDAGPLGEHLLGRRGAEAVLGADEKEVGQLSPEFRRPPKKR